MGLGWSTAVHLFYMRRHVDESYVHVCCATLPEELPPGLTAHTTTETPPLKHPEGCL